MVPAWLLLLLAALGIVFSTGALMIFLALSVGMHYSDIGGEVSKL